VANAKPGSEVSQHGANSSRHRANSSQHGADSSLRITSRSGPLAHARIWRYYAAARVRGELQYPTSFWFGIAAQFLVNGAELFGVWAVFQNTRNVGGWTSGQIMWLFAVTITAFGLANLFVSPIEELPELIRSGRFDAYLLRPTPVLLAVVADGFELRRLGRGLPGVLCIVALLIHPQWFATSRTFASVGGLFLAVIVGGVIFGATFVMMNCISFWLIDSREAANVFTYGGVAVSRYPLDILAPWIRSLFIWGVPVAFIAWLPATRILDTPRPESVSAALAPYAPVAALIACVGASVVWHLGLRRYESTGS
jgi:ABC-2 type transport system permease protein